MRSTQLEFGIRNPEGYMDMTAYEAITKVDKEIKSMEILAGDIWEAELNNGTRREFLVVSSNSRTSVVLSLINDEKQPLQVISTVPMYTDPCRIQYMYNDNFTEYIKSIPVAELDEIKARIADELGIKSGGTKVVEKPVEKVVEKVVEVAAGDKAIEAERDVYKRLYEQLLEKVMSGR